AGSGAGGVKVHGAGVTTVNRWPGPGVVAVNRPAPVRGPVTVPLGSASAWRSRARRVQGCSVISTGCGGGAGVSGAVGGSGCSSGVPVRPPKVAFTPVEVATNWGASGGAASDALTAAGDVPTPAPRDTGRAIRFAWSIRSPG